MAYKARINTQQGLLWGYYYYFGSFFSLCEGGKSAIVESKAIKGLVLVKNLSQSPDKVKKAIIEYIKNQKGKDFMEFYEYFLKYQSFL